MFCLVFFSFAMITLLVGVDGKNVGDRPGGSSGAARGSVCVTLKSISMALVPFCNSMLYRSIVFCKTVNLPLRLFMAWWYAQVCVHCTLLDDCNGYLSYIQCSSDCFSLL